MSTDVPDRYTPDTLGEYRAYAKNGKHTVTLGPPVVRALGLDHGDIVVVEEHAEGVLVRPASEDDELAHRTNGGESDAE